MPADEPYRPWPSIETPTGPGLTRKQYRMFDANFERCAREFRDFAGATAEAFGERDELFVNLINAVDCLVDMRKRFERRREQEWGRGKGRKR